jgi:hypothetical protein
MAFKMKGHELPGPHQRKGAPTKFISLIIGGISAIASAAKKNREKTEAARQKARDAVSEGVSSAKETTSGKSFGSQAPQASASQAGQAKSEGFKADLKGVKGK